MIKKTIVIDLDANKAIKDSEKLGDNLKKIDNEAENVGQSVNQSGVKGAKGVGYMSKAFKTLGIAMKAVGIGLVISLVASLTAAFSKNQKILNAVNTVFGTIGIVFSEVTKVLIDVYENVAKNSENFNGLKKVILGLLTIAITPLKLQFYAIKQAIQVGQLAWEKSFFGGGDKDKIKELTEDIKATQDSLEETAKKAINSGIDVFNNFRDAAGEISNITNQVSDGLSKISVKSAYEQAQINVELKNTAQLAVAQQQRLVEQYDRLAEQQRQLRDDNSKSIAERITANDNLLLVLEKQEKAMLSGADAQIASAQAELKKNKNIENQVALTEALANKEGILAQIEGFRSEQIVNKIALKKEEIDLNNTISDREKERQLAKLDFEAELESKDLLKNKKLQKRLDLENEILLEDIERKRELYAEGTQARVDAEQDFLDAKQELAQKQILLNNKVAEEKTKSEKLEADKQKRIDENVANLKAKLTENGFAIANALAEENSVVSKGVAVAQSIMNTYQGVTAALAQTTDPTPTQTLRFANAAAVGIMGALNVSKILSTNSGSSSNSAPTTSTGSAGGGASAPSFNLVQGSGTNQIAESINSSGNRPIQAYVVSGSVTSAQELDRNIVESSTI